MSSDTSELSVRVLRSGSSGNLTLVSHAGTTILVDAGIPSKKGLLAALREAGLSWDDINGVVVSHLHGDHIHHCAVGSCVTHGVPVFIHKENSHHFHRKVGSRVHAPPLTKLFGFEPFTLGALSVEPFPVPHDADGITCGFSISSSLPGRDGRIAIATDLGHGRDGLHERFADADLILIEANYDAGMMERSKRYDKRRVDGDGGHLSNDQTATLLVGALAVSTRVAKSVVLCHLSRDHNTPSLALSTVRDRLDRHGYDRVELHAAKHDAALPWLSVRPSAEA